MLGRRNLAASMCRPQKIVERQVAVAVVVALQEPALLLSVQRIVGGIEIERDLAGRLGVGIQEQVHEQRLDRAGIDADPGIAAWLGTPVLQPVQRAFARQRRAIAAPGFKLAGQHRQHRVVAEFIVVNEVLVAERDADHALHQQGLKAVFDKGRVAMVLKARSQPPGQADHLVGGAQQQRTSITGDVSAVEGRHHRAAFQAWKVKPRRVTLCRHRGTPLLSDKALSQKNFRSIRAPMHMTRVRNAG
jgi:hypothetical protein